MGKKRITKREIIKLFYTYPRPLSLRDIYKKFSPSRKEKNKIKHILEELVKEGKIIPLAHGRAFGLIKKMEMVEGRIELHPEGYAFVIPSDKRRKDIYISRDNLQDAWHGDRVIVALLPSSRGKSPEGRVVKIIHRAVEELPVILEREISNGIFLAKAADPKLPFDFIVNLEDFPTSSVGDVVLVVPGDIHEGHVFFGKARKTLGRVEEIEVQEEIVKILNSIPRSFPKEVIEEANDLPDKVSEEDKRGRIDLTSWCFVTIDGASARDFDDAICVERIKGGFKLMVAISDVTHYVKPFSALDLEARERGNSYYFPCSVEPMFPPVLSTGLCSLNPQVDRLTMVVEITYSKKGVLRSVRFYPGVIKSRKRLTYMQVKRAILDKDSAEMEKIGEEVSSMLFIARELAEILYNKRDKRGSLDFDIPEPEVLFLLKGTKEIEIKPRERNFAHQMIEEFMIAANEAVASFLSENGFPCLYRVHPWPDEEKLNNLFMLLESLGETDHIPEEIEPKSLQRLLKAVEGKKYEFLVNRLLLRAMMQAYYDVKNIGHFGLASECYCHFTSPIRRYADIVVHRILKYALDIAPYRIPKPKKMRSIAEHLSTRERVALSAERDILKRISILLLKDRIGEEFDGIISSVIDFGFWVEIQYAMAEGLVRVSSLTDDYYIYDHLYQRLIGKRTGKIFGIGKEVRVRLVQVDLDRQRIDFELV